MGPPERNTDKGLVGRYSKAQDPFEKQERPRNHSCVNQGRTGTPTNPGILKATLTLRYLAHFYSDTFIRAR